MEIHVPEGNILEVRVPHETIVEITLLKTTPFKSAPIEVVCIANSKFLTEVLIIFGYYSCKESRENNIQYCLRTVLTVQPILPDTSKTTD